MVEEKSDANEEMSFAELFAKTRVRRDFPEPGQKIEATIVKMTSAWIFLDLGGKNEGYPDRRVCADEEGVLSVKEGDTITACFLYSKANEKLFTSRIGAGNSARNISGLCGHCHLCDRPRFRNYVMNSGQQVGL